MDILGIIILIFVGFGAVLGFKRGFTKELVEALGFIVIIVLAYFLKNPLSVILYEYLPFFKIGILRNVEVLNILVYETIAFILCLLILGILLRVILVVSSVFEKILNATIILGIPSKILGAIVGIIHHYIIAFVVVYILALFFFDLDFVKNSNFANKVLNNTPILSSLFDKSIGIVDDFKDLKDKYSDKTISENEFNYQAIELFLKYDVITPTSLQKLFDNGKIEKFDGYDKLIEKYKGED